MHAFPVRLPSGVRYWTVLDDDLAVVAEADAFLRHVRFGRDGSESTTRAYAGGIALFLRWCARTGRDWHEGVAQFGLFITWLRHAGPLVSGAAVTPGAEVLAGPGRAPARSERRVNGILRAVRGLVVHAVAAGTAPAGLVPLLYEVADHRNLPAVARGEDGRMAWRLRARHRLREPDQRVDQASDEETLGLLRGCRSARDRLIVLLMARAGLRRGEVCGLRRSDVHLLPDSSALGCAVRGAQPHDQPLTRQNREDIPVALFAPQENEPLMRNVRRTASPSARRPASPMARIRSGRQRWHGLRPTAHVV
jgi:integrase/recombinase XerD